MSIDDFKNIREVKNISPLKSTNLPSNLLHQLQIKKQNYLLHNSKKQIFRIDNTISAGVSLSNSRKSSLPKSARYQTLVNNNKKNMIMQNQSKPKPQSLFKRLGKLRKQNGALQNLSISKLISRVKLLKKQYAANLDSEQEIQQSQYQPLIRNNNFKMKRLVIKQKLYNFSEDIEFNQNKKFSDIITSKKYQEDESSKIFRKYYCPPTSSKNMNHVLNKQSQNNFIIRNGKKYQCKRIHNFYSSYLYQKGFTRHCKLNHQDQNNLSKLVLK